MLLVVVSGLGFPVWWEILERIRDVVKKKSNRKNFVRGFSLHTKLVVTTTAVLIFGGAFLILLLDWNHPESLGNLPGSQKIMAAFFQSVTTRTAGFETIPQKNFTDGSALICMVLMFTGGSPMGTAGGVKTTTLAILLLVILSYIKGDKDTVAWKRRVAEDNIRTAVVIFFYALLIVICATTALTAVTGKPLLDCLYEIISAVATVGLTRSLTPTLPSLGKGIVILVMFMGRIGPITLAVALGRRNHGKKAEIGYPKQNILVG